MWKFKGWANISDQVIWWFKLDSIYNHHENKLPGISLREILDWDHWDGYTYPECACHHSVGRGPGLSK